MTTLPAAAPAPFWLRLRAISLYPFRGAALYSLIALTLASLLEYLPGVGVIVSILVWLGAYKYAFEILRATADGRMDAPEVVLDADNSTVWRMLAMQLLFMAAILLTGVFAGPVAALLLLLAIAFVQPGCIMSLAMDGSLRHAMNPATALAIVARIGWPYLAVFALLFVIEASAMTAGGWLARVMPPVLGDLALTLVLFWGLFAAFHLMGYLIYQCHEALGYEPDLAQGPLRDSPDAELRGRAEALVREGDTAAARALLADELRSRALELETHELYHRLLREGGDRIALLDHAGMYLNRLLMDKQERRALGLLREALDADPDFLPPQFEQAVQLAGRARLSGQSQLAADVWRALLRRHPRHADAPRWALDAALLLAERLGHDEEARGLLEQALARSEDAALRAKLEAALKALAPVAT